MSAHHHLPPGVGIGFRPAHFGALAAAPSRVDFIEIHAENYMGAGGPPHAQLGVLREQLPLSVHGVGLSLGGAQALDFGHLARLARVCERYQPHAVSEHLAWSTHDGVWFSDLLPMAYTDATLARTIVHVAQVQDALGRPLLVENPATYVALAGSAIEEAQFLAELSARSGCGLLLDLNNVVVSCRNRGSAPRDYLRAFALEHVGEIHLAGHRVELQPDGHALCIDDHGSPVGDEALRLLADVVARRGALPTLVEWDTDVPAFDVLAAEADRVRAVQRAEPGRRAA